MQGIDPVTSQATGLGLPDTTLTVTAGATRKPGDDHDRDGAIRANLSGPSISQLVSDVVLTAEEMM